MARCLDEPILKYFLSVLFCLGCGRGAINTRMEALRDATSLSLSVTGVAWWVPCISEGICVGTASSLSFPSLFSRPPSARSSSSSPLICSLPSCHPLSLAPPPPPPLPALPPARRRRRFDGRARARARRSLPPQPSLHHPRNLALGALLFLPQRTNTRAPD